MTPVNGITPFYMPSTRLSTGGISHPVLNTPRPHSIVIALGPLLISRRAVPRRVEGCVGLYAAVLCCERALTCSSLRLFIESWLASGTAVRQGRESDIQIDEGAARVVRRKLFRQPVAEKFYILRRRARPD